VSLGEGETIQEEEKSEKIGWDFASVDYSDREGSNRDGNEKNELVSLLVSSTVPEASLPNRP
jgi:hypothetical protein